ncbi:hypothetical protein KKA17_12135, partial [bacterium]|nr:hypothetical protein [bacterium]
MLNIPELEKKWVRYKIKSFIPHMILLMILIIIVPLAIIFYPSKTQEKKIVTIEKMKPVEQNTTTIPNEANQSTIVVKNDVNLSTDIKDDDKLVLKPSLNFVNKIEDSMITYYDDKNTNKDNAKKSEISTKMEDAQKTATKTAPKVAKVKENTPKNEISIKMHSVYKSMQDVIQRFKKTNNPVLSLFLAKKYYEMKKYNLSYNYALVTNQIDSKIDMSW